MKYVINVTEEQERLWNAAITIAISPQAMRNLLKDIYSSKTVVKERKRKTTVTK